MSSIYNINNIIMVNLYNDFILLSTTESKDNIYLKIKKVLENISLGQINGRTVEHGGPFGHIYALHIDLVLFTILPCAQVE